MKKILLISLASISAFSQTSNIFEPIDVFDLEYVSNPQISPSGDKVLYQRNFNDIMTDQSFSNIWLIDYDGTIIDQLLQEILKIILQNGLIKEINLYSNQTEKENLKFSYLI